MNPSNSHPLDTPAGSGASICALGLKLQRIYFDNSLSKGEKITKSALCVAAVFLEYIGGKIPGFPSLGSNIGRIIGDEISAV